jgi:hypothetical protein
MLHLCNPYPGGVLRLGYRLPGMKDWRDRIHSFVYDGPLGIWIGLAWLVAVIVAIATGNNEVGGDWR